MNASLQLLLVSTALLVLCCLASTAWAKPTPSPVSYYHNWVDDQGVSHITPCRFSNWTYVDVLNNTDPDFIDTSASSLAATYVMLQSPVGWTGGWHRNPYPQLVIFIQGVALFTAQDGTEFTFSVGDIYFGEDQLSSQGHLSKNTGDTALTLAFVQFRHLQPSINKPCWLK